MLSAVVVMAVSFSSCASDGRTLEQPTSEQTTTTRLTTTSALPQEISEDSGFELTSPDFEAAGEVPVSMTCDGGSQLPKLEWANTPIDTQELVITLGDYTNFDEPLLVWLGAGIAPNKTSFDISSPPEGFVETQNDWGSTGFGSPCIESIDNDASNVSRDLQFRIYALSTTSELTQGAHGNDSWSDVKAKSFESAAILTRFFPNDPSDNFESDDSTENLNSADSTESFETSDPTETETTELEEE